MTNSPYKYHRKCIENSMENMQTDVRVYRIKSSEGRILVFVTCLTLIVLPSFTLVNLKCAVGPSGKWLITIPSKNLLLGENTDKTTHVEILERAPKQRYYRWPLKFFKLRQPQIFVPWKKYLKWKGFYMRCSPLQTTYFQKQKYFDIYHFPERVYKISF